MAIERRLEQLSTLASGKGSQGASPTTPSAFNTVAQGSSRSDVPWVTDRATNRPSPPPAINRRPAEAASIRALRGDRQDPDSWAYRPAPIELNCRTLQIVRPKRFSSQA